MWIYDEEQKCLDEMVQYPLEAEEKVYRKRQVEKVLNNLFTYALDEE
ncbi:MAG: hypothetical protein OSJ27_08690 [Candidatus Gastranaerophilales bacterium]|nr:hypothetical protein [Candidatus Gastranaerophilales bacterium]